ncbi:MAG: 2-hydroxyacid dehydrogenase [Planctomycetota bacterium]
MKILTYSTKPYDRRFFDEAVGQFDHEIEYFEGRLDTTTAKLTGGFDAVCVFVNDTLDRPVLSSLESQGVKAIALRCAGYNNVDLPAAAELGLKVVRVPAYSPHAVAEHAVALILALNRHIHRAYTRVRDGNFALNGLLGFDLNDRTIGIVGTGQIGAVFAKVISGFGCKLLGYDLHPNDACLSLGMRYVELDELFAESDIISLHCPLTPATHHLINGSAVARMKDGVMIINTSRGAVIDTAAVIAGLKSGRVGHLGLDVYEEEADFFFEDLSEQVLPDDQLARLMTFPNVLITSHQAYFTTEALQTIANVTLQNLADLEATGTSANLVAAT